VLPSPDDLTPEEVAELVSTRTHAVPVKTVQAWLRRKTRNLVGYKVGHFWRVKPEALAAFCATPGGDGDVPSEPPRKAEGRKARAGRAAENARARQRMGMEP
jgi:hypothetical protein